MTKQERMDEAMQIACLVEEYYGENDNPQFLRMVIDRRLPYDTPSFQAAYAALCTRDNVHNQYLGG